jgi:hypothetical protein
MTGEKISFEILSTCFLCSSMLMNLCMQPVAPRRCNAKYISSSQTVSIGEAIMGKEILWFLVSCVERSIDFLLVILLSEGTS